MTTIRISTHRDNRTIGTVTLTDYMTEREIGDVANEAGGMADLVAMGESTVPDGYEWTGDEEWEVGSTVRCHCCGATVAVDAAEWDGGEPYCVGCRDAH